MRYTIATQASKTSVWNYEMASRSITFDTAVNDIVGSIPLRLSVRAWLDIVHPEDRSMVAATATRMVAPDAPVDTYGNSSVAPMEFRVRHADGTWRWVSVRGRALRDAGRRVTGTMGAVVDVTERRRHEAALSRANRAVRNLAGQLITAQEEERRRIARELHDDISQRIAAAAIEASLVRHSLNGDGDTESLARLESQLLDLSATVRALSHRMHPLSRDGGLADNLRRWCEDLRRTGRLDVRLVEGELPAAVPEHVVLCLFRIAQEALRNTMKHAGVRNATLRLGLVGMEERVRVLGGRLDIRSAPGAGTTVRATVPLLEG